MDELKIKIAEKLKNNSRKAVNYIERVIIKSINEALLEKKFDSKIININNKNQIYISEGFLGTSGITIIELRLYQYINGFYKFTEKELLESGTTRIQNLVDLEIKPKNIYIVTNVELKHATETLNIRIAELKSKYHNTNLNFVELDFLDELLDSKVDGIKEAINNVEKHITNTEVMEAVTHKDDWENKRKTLMKSLSEKYYSDDLVLFLGSGASKDAGVPLWDILIKNIFLTLLEKTMDGSNVQFSESEKELFIEYFKEANNGVPTLQAMYLKTDYSGDFEEIVFDALYKDCSGKSKLLDEIIKLCRPIREGKGLDAIVSYNYDDLVERNLEKHEFCFRSIFQDNDFPNKDELPIYHVHGFLPQDKEKYLISEDNNKIVFSEDEYHELYSEYYRWSNLIQLNLLRQKSCLFLGMSMTDPNLRRLLDIAKIKDEENHIVLKHYAILKRDSIRRRKKGAQRSHLLAFEDSNRKVRELYFLRLGVQVIWIDDFDEIPQILSEIRKK